MTSAVEATWLDYAWTVSSCPAGHRRECGDRGGVDPFVDSSVRYPGNLGSAYESEVGVLCVGLVHKSRDPDDNPADADRHARFLPIAEAIAGWRDRGRSPETDERYLKESRSAYEAAIPGWPIWLNQFRPVLKEARLEHDQVAYTNLAKCRAPLDEDDRMSRRLASLCQSTFPLLTLVERLRPAFVLVSSTLGDQIAVLDPSPARWKCWDGRTGMSGDDRPSTWRPLFGGQIRTARRGAGLF